MVSKPLVPPWDDGTKTLVRELVAHGRRFSYRVPVPAGSEGRAQWESTRPWPVYPEGSGTKAPRTAEKLRLMAHLLISRRAAVRHFFFAPNPVSSGASRFIRWARSGPVVQTVCSAPKSFAGAAGLLFGDRVVVLSEHTRRGFVDAGIPAERLRLIHPGVSVPEEPSEARKARTRLRYGLGEDMVVLYAGDYDFSQAARTTLDAAVRVCRQRDDVRFLFAGRIKNQRSADLEQRLKAVVALDGLTERVTFHNLMDDFTDVLGAVDLCVLPAESVYAKVDLPLTLLEAMARKTPVVVADAGPLPELLVDAAGSPAGEAGAADEPDRVGPGAKVEPLDPSKLADTLLELTGVPARLKKMGEAARRAAKKHFSAEAMAAAHEDLYEELIEETESGRGRWLGLGRKGR